MATTIQATFEVTDWHEQPVDETPPASKMTHAHVTKDYAGDVIGSSSQEWLLAYASDRADAPATFVGLERIRGAVAGREGSVVLRHVGVYADGVAQADLTVVPGSGTGALAAVDGTGWFRADPAGQITLDLTFD